jgi:hypothetical protein
VVASSLTIAWRNSVEVPWASSLRRHRDKSPNNLLWSMLQQAVADHPAHLRLRPFDARRSTYHFKAQWGAAVRAGSIGWARAPCPIKSRQPQVPAAIASQRLPLWVTNRVGPRLVRNIP